MTKRSEARRSEDGDAVRVLAPDPNPRHARAVEMTSSTSPPSPSAALVVAALVGLLGVAGFVALLAPGDDSVPETLAPVAVRSPEMAAPETVVAGRSIDLSLPWAAGAGIPGGAVVTDAVVGEGRLIAAGMIESRAAVWGSTTGENWEAATSVETPRGSASRFEAIAEGDAGWIGVGEVDGAPAVWRAEEWQNWDFLGPADDLSDVGGIVGLTAGPGDRFWLIGSDAGLPMLWTSSDGLDWSKRDPGFSSEGVVIDAAVAAEDDGGWLYLAGSRCRDAVCRPALWWTQDGFSWVDAQTAAGFPGGELSVMPGAVATMSVGANRLVAAGSTRLGSFSVPAVWISGDGVTWTASGSGAFALPAVNIRIGRVSDTEPPVASVTVDGRSVDVTAGDTMVTEVGAVAVVSVAGSRVNLQFGDETIELRTGSSSTLQMSRGINSVAVQGHRIVAVGAESDTTGARDAPLAWTSTNGGTSWEMHRLPGPSGSPESVGLRYGRLIALAADGSSWYRDWDGRAEAAAATAVVARLVAALVNGNLLEVIATLPETRADVIGGLELPGFGDIDLEWWDESTSQLDSTAITAAFGFVAELNTAVQLFECSGAPSWHNQGRVRVNCRFRLTSDFHTTMGIAAYEGTLSAWVGEGFVVSLVASGAERPWPELSRWARETDPDAAARTFGSESTEEASPQIDAAVARDALAWAERYSDSFLMPGDSIEVATPVGNMTWSVIDPPGGELVEGVVFSRGAFWAIAAEPDLDAGPGNLSLWRSEDSMGWEALSELPTDGWWRLLAAGDRLFAVGDDAAALAVREWNGTGWTDLEIATPDAGTWWLDSIAESNGHLLILGEGWESRGDRPLGGTLWARAPDGSFDVVTFDEPDLSTEGQRSLIAVESGFVLLNETGWDSPEAEVWGSPDGTAWELLSDEAGFGGGWLRWAGTDGRDLVVVAWGGEDCPVVGEPCQTVWHQWRSTDGVGWELVGELNGDGEVAGGPLGLVALGHGGWWGPPEPMSVLMTDRAGQLVEIADLSVHFTGADWVWAGDIAMSDSAIVVPINAGYDGGAFEGEEDTWLLVGRVLEP